MTPQQYKQLDGTIKQGIDDGQSVYHIFHSHPELPVSVSSVYRMINSRQLTIRCMDLPYAVTYKKRKTLKAYEHKKMAESTAQTAPMRTFSSINTNIPISFMSRWISWDPSFPIKRAS